MKHLLFAMAVAALWTASSCRNSNNQNQETQNDSIDSISVTEPFELPDTQFVSVNDFEYRIDTLDTVRSGMIECWDDFYKTVDGTLTFRRSQMRDADFGGTVSGRPDTVVIEWALPTDSDTTHTEYGVWYGGTGWTGQPLYIHWPDSMVRKFKASPTANLTDDFGPEEVMVGSLCSKVYFINYETGKKSREPIFVNNPIKGTMMLDPLMNGLLYVGHGVPNRHPFGQITVNLFDQTCSNTKTGDYKAWRGWHASDSSPIRVGQFVFRPSENGTIYKYYVKDGVEELHSCMRYRKKGCGAPGMESSMSVYHNYGYVGDNHGNVVCINLNNLKPVWIFNNTDDTDATPIVSVEDGHPYLYVGCEMDRQGETGTTQFAKIDGLNGEKVWTYSGEAKKVLTADDKHFDGGYYATALIGSGNCAGKVFVNYVANENGQNGFFCCFDSKTGNLDYRTKLKCYAWSSPVKFLNEKGEMFALTADTQGRIYLFDCKTGEMLFCKVMGGNFESSPTVIGDHIVLGTRCNKIFKMRVLERRSF